MRDVVYKTIVVKLPVLVPGGLCAPPTRVACPCLVVLRADVQTLARCRGRGVILYLHGNGTDIGGAAEEAKTLARELDCHVVVPEYPGYGLAEGLRRKTRSTPSRTPPRDSSKKRWERRGIE